jgi:hypothetical protein
MLPAPHSQQQRLQAPGQQVPVNLCCNPPLCTACGHPCPAGDVARKHIQDPQLLQFIDLECFLWSTVSADMTPMVNAGMVFSDRHYNGVLWACAPSTETSTER